MQASVGQDAAGENLQKVDHIIVLMMENRSFDHMLGYLKMDGVVSEVEGLAPGMGNHGPDGTFHEVAPLGRRMLNAKVLDPGHGRRDTRAQLAGRNGGFVTNYIDAYTRNREHHQTPKGVVFDPTLVLGYQQAHDLPVYDYLARNWVVCDHWFSSVPAATWENRLFALTGGTGQRVPPKVLGKVPKFLKNAPIYDRPAFVRWLRDEDWRWYSHDPGVLRLVDSRYRPGGAAGASWDANFAYFNRRTLFERRTFLDDVREGTLPAVSWIDPNFIDFRFFGPPGSNDDHPPAPVMPGQELVLTLLVAVMRSAQWPRTLLLIVYDEHGGFYDHVVPGDFPVRGDEANRYGVRVPVLVVSPYVDQGASHVVFDHTSIIRTIIERFSDRPDEALAALGPRTAQANTLGALLTRPDDQPRPPAPEGDLAELIAKVGDWKRRAYRGQLLEEPAPGETLLSAVTELQGEIAGAALHLRDNGLVPGRP